VEGHIIALTSQYDLELELRKNNVILNQGQITDICPVLTDLSDNSKQMNKLKNNA